MIKLKIVEKNNKNFKLKDEKGTIYTLNIDFMDVQSEIKIGDYIKISANLLNPKYAGYSMNYTFGSLKNKYGKEINNLNDIDIIQLKTENEIIHLKRLYG